MSCLESGKIEGTHQDAEHSILIFTFATFVPNSQFYAGKIQFF